VADTLQHLFIAIVSGLSSLGLAWLITRAIRNSGVYFGTNERRLRDQIDLLMTDLIEANKRLETLSRELAETKIALGQAQMEIRLLRQSIDKKAEAEPTPPPEVDFPMLGVFGTDQDITDNDIAALRQSGIPFKRLRSASSLDVKYELSRRRRASDIFRWVHVATHAGPQGIQLKDGVIGFPFWSENLQGIEGVFLAACTDIAIADKILGVVDWVVSTREDIGNEDAWSFGVSFWTHIHDGDLPRQAYLAACKECPALAECIDFRQR
jgi:hypothetical protein